jgi:hypothetical protein
VLALGFLAGGETVSAAPREPLIVTELREPSLVPVSEDASQSSDQAIDQATARFSVAIAEALASDQRALEQACRSRAMPQAGGSANFDWRARCSYQRR